MAFHYEDITTEEDKEYFYSLGLLFPLSSDYEPLHAYRWTIDRDRGAILIALGGNGYKNGPRGTYRISLHWQSDKKWQS